MRLSAILIGLALVSAALLADDRNITFDSHVDFTAIKTFAMDDAQVKSSRPELNNSLFVKHIGDVVREELTSKGLKEVADHADVIVVSSFVGVDYSVGPAGRANMIVPRPGGRQTGFEPVSFTEGTLVIDLMKGDPPALVWHGVYRDPQDSAPKLAQKMPGFVKKLISEYPPKKNK